MVIDFVDSLLGRSSSRARRDDRRGQKVSLWVLLVGVLVAFGGGFFVGGRFGGSAAGPGQAGLNAGGGGRAPELVGEVDTAPIDDQAYVVVAYPGLVAADAKTRADALATWLRGQGLAKAKPYPYPAATGTMWVVAVYFRGASEAAATVAKLRALPESVPDEIFMQRRGEEGWPLPLTIR